MENKLESRIEILDRLSVKYGKHFEVENFEELIRVCDKLTVVIVVRLAMAEYEKQTIKTMYSKSEVIKLINKFDTEATIGGTSELKNKYHNVLSYHELKLKWIEENV